MFLSVLDIFKVGIGPSSSHTVGPMVAGARFLGRLRAHHGGEAARVTVTLHGSLAYTGKGHQTDRAVVLGLLDQRPEEIDPDDVPGLVEGVRRDGLVTVAGMAVSDGDLIHADRHGAVVVPADVAGDIPDAAAKIASAERVLIEASQKPGFDADVIEGILRGN